MTNKSCEHDTGMYWVNKPYRIKKELYDSRSCPFCATSECPDCGCVVAHFCVGKNYNPKDNSYRLNKAEYEEKPSAEQIELAIVEIMKAHDTHILHYHDKEGRTTDEQVIHRARYPEYAKKIADLFAQERLAWENNVKELEGHLFKCQGWLLDEQKKVKEEQANLMARNKELAEVVLKNEELEKKVAELNHSLYCERANRHDYLREKQTPLEFKIKELESKLDEAVKALEKIADLDVLFHHYRESQRIADEAIRKIKEP